jgi:hypothetical protein
MITLKIEVQNPELESLLAYFRQRSIDALHAKFLMEAAIELLKLSESDQCSNFHAYRSEANIMSSLFFDLQGFPSTETSPEHLPGLSVSQGGQEMPG